MICSNNCKECADRLSKVVGGVNEELLGPIDENDKKGKELIYLLKRNSGLVPFNSWISVKERLPQLGVYVLIYSSSEEEECRVMAAKLIVQEYHQKYPDAYPNPFEWEDVGSHFCFSIKDATHWMPLPEPPQSTAHLQDGYVAGHSLDLDAIQERMSTKRPLCKDKQ